MTQFENGVCTGKMITWMITKKKFTKSQKCAWATKRNVDELASSNKHRLYWNLLCIVLEYLN